MGILTLCFKSVKAACLSILEFTEQLFELAKEYCNLGVFRIMIGHHPLIFVCSPTEAEVSVSDESNFLWFTNNQHVETE